MLQFLFFTQPSSSNGLEDITCNRPRTGVARPKNRVKFDPDGQNIDFWEKRKTVTDIFFWFYGGLPFNILLKNGPFTQKIHFSCQKSIKSRNISLKMGKIAFSHFTQKLSTLEKKSLSTYLKSIKNATIWAYLQLCNYMAENRSRSGTRTHVFRTFSDSLWKQS